MFFFFLGPESLIVLLIPTVFIAKQILYQSHDYVIICLAKVTEGLLKCVGVNYVDW